MEFLKDKIEVILKRGGEDDDNQFEISLRDIINTLWRNRILILALTILLPVLVFIGLKVFTPTSFVVKTIISYNYGGVEKGLDPYGKKLDVSIINSPVVLDQVIKNLALDQKKIEVDDLRSCILITPMVPGNVIEMIKKLDEAKQENVKDLQEYSYYPNQYIISMNVPKKLHISAATGQQILDEVYKEYSKYFYKTYAEIDVLANAVGPIEFEQYDYPEISEIITNQVAIIQNYLTKRIETVKDFRSSNTGLSFVDIRESITTLVNVDIHRMDSLIGSYNLTKDKDSLVRLYEYKIKQLELEKMIKDDEAKIATDAIKSYQKDKSMVLIPGLTDGDNGFGGLEAQDKNEYYDQLNDRATNAGVSSSVSKHNADYYRNEIIRLQKDTTTNLQKQSATKDVLAIAQRVKTNLEKWIELTNETASEYYQREMENTAVKLLSAAEVYPATENVLKILTITLIIGFMLGIFISFGKEYMQVNPKHALIQSKNEKMQEKI